MVSPFLFLVLDIETRVGKDCIGLAQKRFMAVLNVRHYLALMAAVAAAHLAKATIAVVPAIKNCFEEAASQQAAYY